MGDVSVTRILLQVFVILWVLTTAVRAEVQGPTVLERRCLSCHGPGTKMGKLDLSTRESALRGGSKGPALVPSEPGRSLLLTRVAAGEMPPEAPLSSADKKTLREWIVNGAVWLGRISGKRADENWWSLQPLRKVAPPGDDQVDLEWRTSPIDRWIFAQLAAEGLRPAPRTDRQTLIRRLTLDLTGLPPTPEEVESFVHSKSSNDYEVLVDRLLASDHYGERWARHWLDLVRFSESEGFERDLLREHAWPYRDYVIRSFNSDKSYLQFAKEQLAGDVMDPATYDGITATSLLTLGPIDAVGLTSAIERERATIREEQLEEMLGVVSQTFLGLTVNCARCHDHKFDPISQQEYYRMKASLQAVWPPIRPNTSGAFDSLLPHGRPLLTPNERLERKTRTESLKRRIEEIDAELGEHFRSERAPDSFDVFPRPLDVRCRRTRRFLRPTCQLPRSARNGGGKAAD